MSLAEELLADFEDGETADIEEPSIQVKNEAMETDDASAVNGSAGKNVKSYSLKDARITEYACLMHSDELSSIMHEIKEFNERPKRTEIIGPVESDPEYQCIVQANDLIVEIDNEIGVIHKYILDLYNERFPELESLVPNPLDYIRTVATLKNDILDKSVNCTELAQLLTSATIMVISVSASTTQGKPISEENMSKIIEACEMGIELNSMKSKIISFVESRMSLIAPNVCIVAGSSCAAKIIGHAGGLTALSKIPACNICVLGSQKKILGGFSSSSTLPHTGYIYHSDFIQNLPPDIRMKAAKLVGNKLTLAARVDALHESKDGSIGERLRLEVEKKLDKWLEPPPVKSIKPLPIPVDPPAKKRGGRRYRKMKERMGMSEMRRTANRMQFGSTADDAYQEDLGYSSGSLGKKGVAGRIRAPQVDSKTKARVSKALQQKLNKYGGLSTMPTDALGATSSWGAKSTIRGTVTSSGTASSIAFTPLQGLEIVNPNATEKPAEEGKKYFSAVAGFSKVKTPLPPPS